MLVEADSYRYTNQVMAKISWLRTKLKQILSQPVLHTRNHHCENTNGALPMWYSPQLPVGVKQIVLIISSWILLKASLQ